jgi:hypothetical protein
LSKAGAGAGSAISEYHVRLKKRKWAIDTYYELCDCDEGKNYPLWVAYKVVAEKHGLTESQRNKLERNYLRHLEEWKEKAAWAVESGLITFGDDGKPKTNAAGPADDLREIAIMLQILGDSSKVPLLSKII